MDRDDYVAATKSAFISLAKKAVLAQLARELPSLFVGKLATVFNPLLGLIVEKVITIAATSAETGAFFLYIDMRTGKSSKEFELAAEENWKAQQSGTPEQKLHAEAKLKKTFEKFARLDS